MGWIPCLVLSPATCHLSPACHERCRHRPEPSFVARGTAGAVRLCRNENPRRAQITAELGFCRSRHPVHVQSRGNLRRDGTGTRRGVCGIEKFPNSIERLLDGRDRVLDCGSPRPLDHAAPESTAPADWRSSQVHGQDVPFSGNELYTLAEPQSLQHLFKVACGLDSMVLGETEILGQLKQAYALAQARGHTGARLNKAFQRAFHVAKHVRTLTGIQRGSVSVASAAVELAGEDFQLAAGTGGARHRRRRDE